MDNQEKKLINFDKWDDVMKHKTPEATTRYFNDSEVVDIALAYHKEQMDKKLDELFGVKVADICCYPPNDTDFANGVDLAIEHYQKILKKIK